MNSMKQIRIEKVTLNIGCGKDQGKMEKGLTLLKRISGKSPTKTYTTKRIQEWGLRPGLPIGCKVTLRKEDAIKMAQRVFDAKDKKLLPSQVDTNGNISFGINEYIDIPGAEYDPKLGIIGLQVCITLERPGFRVKKRRAGQSKIPPAHKITKDQALEYMNESFGVGISED